MADKPDFIIAGAAKSGTTALNAWLAAHPDVCMAEPKEPSHFTAGARPVAGPFDRHYYDNYKTDWAAYQTLFAAARGRVCGEVSPIYMLDHHSPQLIADRLPEAKIVIVLREPVSRAFSHFSQHVRDGLETTSDFAVALELASKRKEAGWSLFHDYVSGGLYAKQIRRFLAHFPRRNVLALLHEDMENDPKATWRRVCAFIGVDAVEGVDFSKRHNEAPLLTLGGGVASLGKKVLSAAARTATSGVGGRAFQSPQPVLAPELAERLGDFYRSHNASLAELLDLDLAAWTELRSKG